MHLFADESMGAVLGVARGVNYTPYSHGVYARERLGATGQV